MRGFFRWLFRRRILFHPADLLEVFAALVGHAVLGLAVEPHAPGQEPFVDHFAQAVVHELDRLLADLEQLRRIGRPVPDGRREHDVTEAHAATS